MGLSWKSVGGVLNPVGLAGTALAVGGDLYAADQASKAAREANETNLNMTREQIAHQREFAKMGVRWRVEDAVAAGLHPLAALGVQSAQFSPVSFHREPDYSRSEFAAKMGQNLSRAVQTTMLPHERAEQELRLENMKLQNDLLRSQISHINNPVSPPFPGPATDPYLRGQGDVGKGRGTDTRVLDKPFDRYVADRSDPSRTAGAISSYQYESLPGGGWRVVPSPEAKQRMEDDVVLETQWKASIYQAAMQGRLKDPDGNRVMINPITGRVFKWPRTNPGRNRQRGRPGVGYERFLP